MKGSSDIGNVDYRCPAFHPMMGIGIEENCHTQEFADAMTTQGAHDAIKNSASLLLCMTAKCTATRSCSSRSRRTTRPIEAIKIEKNMFTCDNQGV